MSPFSFWSSPCNWDLQQAISWKFGQSLCSHVPWFSFMPIDWGSSLSPEQEADLPLSVLLMPGEPAICTYTGSSLHIPLHRLGPSEHARIYCDLGYLTTAHSFTKVGRGGVCSLSSYCFWVLSSRKRGDTHFPPLVLHLTSTSLEPIDY